ncbi:Cyclic AMP-responsive element-binding protein 3-like protein 3 [Oopsacas minuta]|uniref:Cyclic AMP-responsive element-binding protein 3-like protein 3 n=1 Tax=Oopsacas minuta TaxID=111878 RepID=A0AAV7JU26_9METZ|nr:Cyclic AMP-responsive element-binding protein 3-like protein 3 [Oopsacas minuta]
MYRKTHNCDSTTIHKQQSDLCTDDPFTNPYRSITSETIHHLCNDTLPDSINIQNPLSQLYTEKPLIGEFETFHDISFDPTSFTQVEDLLLPIQDDNFFSNEFLHLDRNSNEAIHLNSTSNSPHLSANDSVNYSLPEFHHTQDHKTNQCQHGYDYLYTIENCSNADSYAQFSINAVDSSTYIDSDIQVNKPGRKPKPLKLTEDEKFILRNEGVVIPENVRTLTKTEERHIKQVKRRIKNKLSAAESRKRKKDYLDGLEERVQQTTSLNSELQRRVGELERQNVHLITTVKRMKSYISSYVPNISKGNPALFMFIFAFTLFSIPSWISLSNTILQPHLFNMKHFGVGSRTLLSQNSSHSQWMSIFNS